MRTQPSRWYGAKLDALRKAYEARKASVADVAARFGISVRHIARLAKRHGWRLRVSPLPETVHRHGRLYKKLLPIVGREVALKTIARIYP